MKVALTPAPQPGARAEFMLGVGLDSLGVHTLCLNRIDVGAA